MMLSNFLALGAAAFTFVTASYAQHLPKGKIIEAIPRSAAVSPYEAICPALEANPDGNAALHTTKGGNTYIYICDTGFLPSATIPIYQNDDPMTTEQCLNACDSNPQCLAGMLTPGGQCRLSTDIKSRMYQMTGTIGFSLLSNATRLQPYETTPAASGSPTPTQTTGLTAGAEHKKRIPQASTCINSECWDYDYVCTYSGTQATTKDLNDMLEYFCEQEDGYSVGSGTTLSKIGTASDGTQLYAGVRDWAKSGSWLMDGNLCNAGFGAILNNCTGNGGSQGGYIWYYYKGLTFVLGVDGNQPTTYCGGYC